MFSRLEIAVSPPPPGMCPACYREAIRAAMLEALDEIFRRNMGGVPEHQCPPAAIAAAEQLLKGGPCK